MVGGVTSQKYPVSPKIPQQVIKLLTRAVGCGDQLDNFLECVPSGTPIYCSDSLLAFMRQWW